MPFDYEKLRAALIKMPPAGASGFEGFVASLLTALTGDQFYIARSGDQPADGISQSGEIALQGKRYDKTSLDETEFEGDFFKACRLCPSLDCYVLATTRCAAQLKLLADDLEQQTGVDIIILEFGDSDSELPALCVTYWNQIKSFESLSKLDGEAADWASVESKRGNTVETIARLRNRLTGSVPLAAMVRRRLVKCLNLRFNMETDPLRPPRFLIDLDRSIARKEPLAELDAWWADSKTRTAAVIGQEGMGKSWFAAEFANRLARNHGALVLWFDSADWTGLGHLESVVDVGLRNAGFTDLALRKRLAMKAMTRWSDRLLVVLDGINEREAKRSVPALIAALNSSEKPQCRLLFTTRPIVWESDERSLWSTVAKVELNEFTDSEFDEALRRLPEECLELTR